MRVDSTLAAASSALLFTPRMAPVRADPRIIDVVERIELLDYWRATGDWPDFCRTEPQSGCDKMKGAQTH